VLVLALLWAQALGQWHSIAHADHGHGIAAAPSALVLADLHRAGSADEHEHAHASGFLERVFFDHHSEFECHIFDQLSHGDLLTATVQVALPCAVPLTHLLRLEGLAVARWAAQFQARAPPPVR